MINIERKGKIDMVDLSKLRITSLKCLSCGCRDKRIAILKSTSTGKSIGFSTICCNCGHVKTYIFRKNKNKYKKLEGEVLDNKDIVDSLEGNQKVSCIFCAIPGNFCTNITCPLHKSGPKRELLFSDIEEGRYKSSAVFKIPEGEKIKDPERGKFI